MVLPGLRVCGEVMRASTTWSSLPGYETPPMRNVDDSRAASPFWGKRRPREPSATGVESAIIPFASIPRTNSGGILPRVMTLRDHQATGRRDHRPRDCGPAGHDSSGPSLPGCGYPQRPHESKTFWRRSAPRAFSFLHTLFDQSQSDRIQPSLTSPQTKRSHPIQADPTQSEPIKANEAPKYKKMSRFQFSVCCVQVSSRLVIASELLGFRPVHPRSKPE